MKTRLLNFFATWQGSTLQLIAAVLLPLTFLLILISFISYFVHLNAMRDMVAMGNQATLTAISSDLESEVQRRLDFTRSLAYFSGGDDTHSLEQALADAESSRLFDIGLALFAPDGTPLAQAGDSTFWHNLAWQNGRAPLSSLRVDGKTVLLTSVSAPSGRLSALGAFTPAAFLQPALDQAFPMQGSQAVYILDSQRNILYTRGAAPGFDPAAFPGLSAALGGKSGSSYQQTASGEVLCAYSPLPGLGWAILSVEPWSPFSVSTLQTSLMVPLISIPALLLTVLALWSGSVLVIKPLRQLEEKTSRLALGDFHELSEPVQGIAEIRHLQNELVHLAERLSSAQQALHGYIGAITRGQESERQRLARDLHDDTIQTLVSLRQRIQILRLGLPRGVELPALDSLEEITTGSVENLRRTIRDLRPLYLDQYSLCSALEMLVEETRQGSGLEIEFSVSGQERALDSDVETALYRICQEVLNNIRRHAHASRVSLQVGFEAHSFNLRIHDNGSGFEIPSDPATFARSGHYGLLGMRERAQLIGARLELHSAPGQGTHVTLTLPLF